MISRFHLRTAAAVAVLTLVGIAPPAAWAQYTWVNSNNQTGQWDNTARWTGGPAGTFPNSADSTATFNLPLSNAPSGNYNVQISSTAGAAVTVAGITVNNYSDGGVNDINNLRFGANGNGTLTFQSNSGPAFFTENAASPTDSAGATRIFAPTTFASDTVFTQNHLLQGNVGTAFSSTNNSPGGITAAPGITLTKEGQGNLTFDVAPAGPGTGFQGALVVNNGAVRLESNVFANASAITVNAGGQLQLGSSAVTNWSLAPGSVLTLNGSGKGAGLINPEGALRFQNGAATASFDNPVSLASDSTVFVAANLAPTPPNPVTYGHLTLAQEVSGAGALVKSGPGILELPQANTYQGGTTVNEGTLLVSNATGSGTGSGPVTVNAGATLGGAGFIDGPVSLVGGTLAPGASPGLLTLEGLSLDSLSLVSYELDTAGVIDPLVNDLTQVNGDFTLDGTLSVIGLPGFGEGVYRLFNYTGGLTDNGLDIGPLPTGFSGQIVSGDGAVSLVVSVVPEPSSIFLAAIGVAAVAGTAVRHRRRRLSR
jgi:autotransporter-associated beta strand protein